MSWRMLPTRSRPSSASTTARRWRTGRAEIPLTQRYLRYYGGLADKLEGRQIPLGPGMLDYTIHAPFGVSGAVRALERPPSGGRALDRLRSGDRQHGGAEIAGGLAATACSFRRSLRARWGAAGGQHVCGLGPEAGAALVGHHDIDHIVFTGSVETGKSVLRAAATGHSLRDGAGGKSGAIVFPDADLDRSRPVRRQASSSMRARSVRPVHALSFTARSMTRSVAAGQHAGALSVPRDRGLRHRPADLGPATGTGRGAVPCRALRKARHWSRADRA